jgi:site-specific DNA-methyltransferase (adenine-specific)
MNLVDVLEGRARWAVLHGDCREGLPLLPSGSVDVAVTDPPYSHHVHSKQRRMLRGGGRRGGSEIGYAPLGFEALDEQTRSLVAGHLGRLVRRWCLVFSDAEHCYRWREELADAGLRHVREGAWVKLNGQPQLSGDRPAVGHEAIEIAHGQVKCRWSGGGLPALWAHAIATDRNGTGARVHTTQKPLELMLRLVEQFSEPGELVLDPFAGAGTTGIACLRLGRRYLGWEIDEHYAQVAREQLLAESRGLTMLEARAGQTSLWDSERPVPEPPPQREFLERPNGLSSDKIRRIAQLRGEGLSLAVISERLGVHPNTVHRHLQRAGLVRKRWCSCGRRLRGDEPLCYTCRGYRPNGRFGFAR